MRLFVIYNGNERRLLSKMEQKKLPQADLDRRRTTGFLLGLVFVSALLFVALEFDMTAALGFDPDDLFSDTEENAELAPLFKEEQQLVLLAPEEQNAPAEHINIVEETPELQPEQLNTENNTEGEGDDKKVEDLLDDMEDIAPPEINPRDNPEKFRVVEDMPQFPGGAVAFLKWLTTNLKYPAAAKNAKIEGKVVAQFIVNTDGSISDLKLTKRLHPQCDREALRVLQMMPRWTPGVENDKPCRTRVCIPIVFKL